MKHLGIPYEISIINIDHQVNNNTININHSRYTGYKFYIRIGNILILKNKVSMIGFGFEFGFTSEPNLCLNVYDGNLGDMLT